jgi:predicted nuclease with RNAse H fold
MIFENMLDWESEANSGKLFQVMIAGIDLAAEPKSTALALVDFSAGAAKLETLVLGIADPQLVERTKDATKIGIDCAFGWPVEFYEFLGRHMDPKQPQTASDGAIDWRRSLAYRETDRQVKQVIGRWPLSVSTDRLGLTAMRNAGLLARLQESGVATDRSGEGTAVEVYPAATLRLWSFDTTNYRKSEEQRQKLIQQLKLKASWLDVSKHQDLMNSSTDAFDAVIAALAARAVALGLYLKPLKNQLAKAKVEGWICLPSVQLDKLRSS